MSEARQLGKPPPSPPEPHYAFADIWQWHSELALGRATGGYGVCALTWADIEVWSRRSGIDPSPAQASLILAIDGMWRAETHRLQELTRPKT